METTKKTGALITPAERVAKLSQVCAGMSAWILRWKWRETWLRLQRGEPVNPFHRHWVLMSIERRAGRLPRPPRSETIDLRTGEPVDPPSRYIPSWQAED